MELRPFGRLGRVSALTLGGGGIGGVWGATDRAEAIATVHAALDGGITHLDVAPSYGAGSEAEVVVGEALRRWSGAAPLITTKVQVHDDEVDDPVARIRESLTESLRRLGREHLDLLLVHSQLRRAGATEPSHNMIGVDRCAELVVPELVRLRDAGTIRAWGITGCGHPDAVHAALTASERPDAVQVVVNALDLPGDMWMLGDEPRPSQEDQIASAADAGVAVIGIRAVGAGAFTGRIDRAVEADSTVARDFARAAGFRALAAELGEEPQDLAHRWALTAPDVATVVLGVKNRAELEACLEAERRGPLAPDVLDAIAALRRDARV